MSHRFVRCPHCKMPHDAAERVCPNTGLQLPLEARSEPRGASRASSHSLMSEVPPPPRPPKPLAFEPQRGRIPERARVNASASEIPSAPPTKNVQHALIGQVVGDRYRIKGVLGEGGMGTVYDAEHLGLSRQVAVKVLSPSQAKKRVAVKRFQQEARAAGAIGHPNICEVYDLGLLDDGSPYLVMEKLVGQTLADRIAREGGLPFDEVIEIVAQVLSGLVAAHEKGIVHRDIKPENIFLARRVGAPPIIKLLDFGVSKMMPEFQTGEDALDLTRTGMVMGTPYYMSPEQARGDRNLDGRVDVYACGVVMYEALIGKRPFLAPNYNALLLAIINTSPRPIRELRPATPPELETIVRRAMEKSRSDRYPTAKHFLRELMPSSQSAGTVGPGGEAGARVPAPPTAEERKRAPVLGGGRGRPEPAFDGDETRVDRNPRLRRPHDAPGMRPHPEPLERAPSHRAERPSTTLKSHMTNPRTGASGPASSRGDQSDSIEIPIDFATDDEDATEFVHPEKHPPPPPPAPGPRGAGGAKPRTPAHVSKGALSEDWDGKTEVQPTTFNPEETMKLDGSELEQLGHPRSPPRRRR